MSRGLYPWFVLGTVLIGTFMGVVDGTIVNVALHSIKASFGVSLDAAQWVATAYLLALAVMLLVSPWLGEQIGYKWAYILGLSFFTLFSLLCGIAWNLNMLLLFRAFQGFGGGILGTVGMVLWRREFPPDEQALPMGIYMVAVGSAVAFGPPLGGYLIEKLTWPAIFFINVPIGVVGIGLALFLLRSEKRAPGPPLDWVGFISLCLFLTALITALAEGNAAWNTGGWTSSFMVGCYFVGAVSLILFIATELRVDNPLVDLRIFLDRNFAVGSFAFLAFSIVLAGTAIIGPLYVQSALGYSQLQSGLVILPIGLIMSVVGIVAGAMAHRFNMKGMCVVGLVIFSIGCYMGSRYGLYTERSWILSSNVVTGFGLGLLMTPLSTLMLAWMPPQLIGSASGAFQAMRNIGGAVGVALYDATVSGRQVYHLQVYGQAADSQPSNLAVALHSVENYLRGATGTSAAELSTQSRAVLGVWFKFQAFVSSVDDVYWLGMALLLISIVPVLFLRSRKGGAVVHVGE